MLLIPDIKAALMRVRNPEQVASVLPGAGVVEYRGQKLVVAKHNAMNRVILSNLGIKMPGTLDRYNWPGIFKPFDAQRKTVDFLMANPRAYCLNDLGTGKTSSVLWAFDALRRQKVVRKMLVVSPLSTLQRTWGDEAFRTLPHLKSVVLHGSKEKRLKMLATDADIYIINHHGVEVIREELVKRTDIDLVVIDEVAIYRNPRTAMWKAMNSVVRPRQWAWGLTGTPTPNSPTDAYGQVRLLTPQRVPHSARAFREMVMTQLGQFKWVPKREATDVVKQAMQPAIRFSREQCLDLPPVIYMDRDAPLTTAQKAAYDEMKKTLIADVAGAKVQALNTAVMLSKLVQIACGVVYDQSGSEQRLSAAHRSDIVREIIDQSLGKVIVFAPYKSVVRALHDDLSKDHSCAMITGDTGRTERDTIYSRMQRDPTLRVLVASPSAMSHGLTLTQANTIVWYAPVTSNETYQQANARISRAGQTLTQFVVNISGSPVETAIYKRLAAKQALQGDILDLLQEA